MAKIEVRISSVDGFSRLRRFKTVKRARKFALNHVGTDYEIGMGCYAISSDGVGKATAWGVLDDGTTRITIEHFFTEAQTAAVLKAHAIA